MLSVTNPSLSKLKTSPSWRFKLLKNPAKYGFGDHLSVVTTNARFLRRHLDRQITINHGSSFPEELNSLELSKENKFKLLSLWREFAAKRKLPKLELFITQQQFGYFPSWKTTTVDKLRDSALVSAAKHISNIEYNQYVAEAVNLYHATNKSEIVKFIGYMVFAGSTAKDIALRWNIPVKTIEILISLFFDFSFFPKDRIAKFSCLRQLVVNADITEDDFSFYKRAYELGNIGLKAHADFGSLNKEERNQVEEFLGRSVVANVLQLHLSLRTKDDSVQFMQATSTLGNHYVKQAEIKHIEARVSNLNATTKRIDASMVGADVGVTPEDEKWMALLEQLSHQEAVVEYKKLDSLK